MSVKYFNSLGECPHGTYYEEDEGFVGDSVSFYYDGIKRQVIVLGEHENSGLYKVWDLHANDYRSYYDNKCRGIRMTIKDESKRIRFEVARKKLCDRIMLLDAESLVDEYQSTFNCEPIYFDYDTGELVIE